jgi:hypothetical protein
MPRAEAEALAVGGKDAATARCRCSSCGAIGQFASDSSEEWRDFANDLVFDAYAAHLQKAGYEVRAYSHECDNGDHEHCPDKNRLGVTKHEHCWCVCHKHWNPIASEPAERSDDDTVG